MNLEDIGFEIAKACCWCDVDEYELILEPVQVGGVQNPQSCKLGPKPDLQKLKKTMGDTSGFISSEFLGLTGDTDPLPNETGPDDEPEIELEKDDEDANRVQLRPEPKDEPAAVANYVRAATQYIQAIRQKEALRTALNKNKLKSLKWKNLTEHTKEQIKAVRYIKTLTKREYQAAWKAMEKYTKSQEVVQLNDIAINIQQLKQINEVIKKLRGFEEGYGKNSRKVSFLKKSEIINTGKSIGAGISVTLNLVVFKLSVNASVKYTAVMNVQDDRRLRVASSWTVSAGAKAEVVKLVNAELSGSASLCKTVEVFIDAQHWAAVIAARAENLIDKENRPAGVEGLFGDNVSELFKIQSLATVVPVVKVNQSVLSSSASLAIPALNLDMQLAHETVDMTFTKPKPNVDGKRIQLVGKQESYSGGFKFPDKTLLSVTYTSINNHGNPDNDGDYLNLKLVFPVSASGTFKPKADNKEDSKVIAAGKWLAKALGMEEKESEPDATVGHGEISVDRGVFADSQMASNAEATIKNRIKEVLTAAKSLGGPAHFVESAVTQAVSTTSAQIQNLQSIAKATIETTLKGSVSVELNCVIDNKQLVLQYIRASRNTDSSASVTCPVYSLGGVLEVGLSLDVGRSDSMMMFEIIGDGTFTYIQTVYDGFKIKQERNAKLGLQELDLEFEQFLRKHKRMVTWLLHSIVKKETNAGAYKELNADASLAVTSATQATVTAAKNFMTAAAALSSQTADKYFDALLPTLIEYLKAKKAYTYGDRAAQWTDVA